MVSDSIDCLPRKYKINEHDFVESVIQAVRPIPVAMRDDLNKNLTI